MDMVSVMVMIALTVITHYKILGFFLMVMIAVNLVKVNREEITSRVKAAVIPFCLAIILVIGVPLGIIKGIYPEANIPEEKIIEEAMKWNR